MTLGALADPGASAAALLLPAHSQSGFGERSAEGLATLGIFGCAVIGWISPKLDNTFVALADAGVSTLEAEHLLDTLGSESVWL